MCGKSVASVTVVGRRRSTEAVWQARAQTRHTVIAGPSDHAHARGHVHDGRSWHRSCTFARRSRASAKTEGVMRVVVFFATLGLIGVAMPVLAQEQPASDPKGFVSASGGFVSALGDKTSDFR